MVFGGVEVMDDGGSDVDVGGGGDGAGGRFGR